MRTPILTWIVSPSTTRTTVPSSATGADHTETAVRSASRTPPSARTIATRSRCHAGPLTVNLWIRLSGARCREPRSAACDPPAREGCAWIEERRTKSYRLLKRGLSLTHEPQEQVSQARRRRYAPTPTATPARAPSTGGPRVDSPMGLLASPSPDCSRHLRSVPAHARQPVCELGR